MSIIKGFLCNEMLICAMVAYFTAQILKIVGGFLHEGKWNASLIFASGGMPSSHSSTVCALAISAARVWGTASPAFAIAFILAAIVMYDATGVRRAAGEQAKVLNHIVTDLFSGNPEYTEKALKELIGHTPFQVVVGAVLGILIGLFFPPLAPLFA